MDLPRWTCGSFRVSGARAFSAQNTDPNEYLDIGLRHIYICILTYICIYIHTFTIAAMLLLIFRGMSL